MLKKITVVIAILLSCLTLLIGCSSSLNSDEKQLDKPTSTTDNDNDNDESSVVATIYTCDEQAESLVNKEVNLKELSAESIFLELINANVIAENTTLKSFDTYTGKKNESIGIINVSSDFYNFNLGSSYEIMMLNSIAKTYIENFNLNKFKILINGEDYESGHILFDKDDYFTKESLE